MRRRRVLLVVAAVFVPLAAAAAIWSAVQGRVVPAVIYGLWSPAMGALAITNLRERSDDHPTE